MSANIGDSRWLGVVYEIILVVSIENNYGESRGVSTKIQDGMMI